MMFFMGNRTGFYSEMKEVSNHDMLSDIYPVSSIIDSQRLGMVSDISQIPYE